MSSGLVLWTLIVLRMIAALNLASQSQDGIWQLDWRVYEAGGHQLLDRTLYSQPLKHPTGAMMPVDFFNLPPGAAVAALPFLIFPGPSSGDVWLAAAVCSLLVAVAIGSRLTGVAYGWVWVAFPGLLYAMSEPFPAHLALGNNNSVVLLLTVGFAWALLASRAVLAGGLLAAAIAIKLWPAALLIVLARERSWGVLAWTAVFLGVAVMLTVVWLGPDVLNLMTASILTFVPIAEGTPVVWTSWAREVADGPDWIAPAVGVAMLALPTGGLMGVATGILGGLSFVNNLWDHYLPTLFLAFSLGVGAMHTSLESKGWHVHEQVLLLTLVLTVVAALTRSSAMP